MTADHPHDPTDDAILAYLLGDTDAPGAAGVPGAAAARPAVQARVDRLGRIMRDLSSAGALASAFHVEPGPREVLRRLADRAAPQEEATPASLAARLARVVLDSFASASPGLGFRGTASDRLVRYQCGGLTVDLRVSGSGVDGPIDVSGELLPPGPALISLTSASGGAPELLQPVGDDGFFSLSTSSGRYRLVIETPDSTVDLGEIALGAAVPPGPGPSDA